MPGGAGFQPSTVLNLYKWVERLYLAHLFLNERKSLFVATLGRGYIAEAYLVAHGT